MSEQHIFFNVIHFPKGKEEQEQAFEGWKAIGSFMEKQPGFLGSTLYRNRKDPLMLINKGRYDSEESFFASVKSPQFQELSQRLTDLGVERVAGLYEVVQLFGGGGD